jgi:arginase
MGLAILTGGCWRALRETIPGFTVVDEAHVALVGVRDLEPYQRERIARSRLLVAPGAEPPDGMLDALRERVGRVYLHVDLDVLDTSVGRANPYAAPGGPGLEAVLAAVGATFDRFDVGAAALTSYDPRVDEGGAIAAAARAIAGRIAAAAWRSRAA